MADAYVPTSDATLRCAAGAGYTEAMDHPIAWQTQSGAIVPGMQATNAQGQRYGWHALVYRTCGVEPSQGQSPLALIIQRLEAGCDPLWAARKLREYAAGVQED